MNKQSFQTCLKESVLIFDGAMGTELYRRQVFINRSFDEACVSQPDIVLAIHREYLSAGADVLTTNTYGATSSKLARFGLAERAAELATAGVKLAQKAAAEAERPILVAGSVGPLDGGSDLANQRIAEISVQIRAMVAAGVDFLFFETLPHRRAANEALAAVQAADATNVPILLSFAVNEDKTSAHGERVQRLLAPFEGKVQPAALGFNCGVGPERMLSVLEEAVRCTNLPLIIRPNAGQPRSIDGRQIPLCSQEYFTSYGRRAVELGARGIGGCCGVGPGHIRELAAAVKPLVRIREPVSVVVTGTETARPQLEIPLGKRSCFGARIAAREWVKTIEILPPRGFDLKETIAKSAQCKAAGIHAINLPDGPRASARISPLITAVKIQNEAGIETILHVCARDRNLIGLQADLLGCAAMGVANLLFITGDPPKLGNFHAVASAVFDADSIGLVAMQKSLNQGLDLGRQAISPPTAAVIGVGADPNALDLDREMSRLHRKVDEGAEFVITQPAFAPQSLLDFIGRAEKEGIKIPFLAGIWPLASLRNALFMKHEVPGVFVPDEIIARMERHTGREDQRKVGIEIAREMLDAVHTSVCGVQVSAPLGKVETALEVLD